MECLGFPEFDSDLELQKGCFLFYKTIFSPLHIPLNVAFLKDQFLGSYFSY